jgi:hypothetical protein
MISSLSAPAAAGASAQFTVSIAGGGAQSLRAPALSGPSGVIRIDNPVFSWSPVTGATGYVLFYTRSNGQDPGWTPLNVTTTSAQPILDSKNDTYIWWVMAYDAAGDTSPP